MNKIITSFLIALNFFAVILNTLIFIRTENIIYLFLVLFNLFGGFLLIIPEKE